MNEVAAFYNIGATEMMRQLPNITATAADKLGLPPNRVTVLIERKHWFWYTVLIYQDATGSGSWRIRWAYSTFDLSPQHLLSALG
jgi:hypothetical protein